MQPKIVKLPHLKVTHVNLPGAPPAPAPRKPPAEDDWSAVYVPAHEPSPPTTASEVQQLSALWSDNQGDASGPDLDADLSSLWMSGLEASEAAASEFDFEFSTDIDPYDGPRPQTASARFRVDRPPRQESPRAEVPRPERRLLAQQPAPEPPPARAKTPMERAAEYTSRPSAYKRLTQES